LQDNQLGGCRLDPKNQGQNFSSGFLHSEILGQDEILCYAMIFALSPVHSDITRFRPWSLIAAIGNHLDRDEGISNTAQEPDTVDVFD
jgi:hypothetical protein